MNEQEYIDRQEAMAAVFNEQSKQLQEEFEQAMDKEDNRRKLEALIETILNSETDKELSDLFNTANTLLDEILAKEEADKATEGQNNEEEGQTLPEEICSLNEAILDAIDQITYVALTTEGKLENSTMQNLMMLDDIRVSRLKIN